jgi:hypothetical protein
MALTISEDLALLAFDEHKGRFYDRVRTALPHALAGTLVVDLVDAEAVELHGDKLTVTTVGSAPDDPLLHPAWQAVADARAPKPLRTWISRPTHLLAGLPDPVYQRLVERGLLEDEGRSTLFRRHRYHEVDGREGRDLLAAFEHILDGEREPTGDELVLLALLPVCRLTSAVLPERDRRATERRIDDLLSVSEAGLPEGARVARVTAADVAAAVAREVAVIAAAATA